jgi:hypothetical protein
MYIQLHVISSWRQNRPNHDKIMNDKSKMHRENNEKKAGILLYVEIFEQDMAHPNSNKQTKAK